SATNRAVGGSNPPGCTILLIHKPVYSFSLAKLLPESERIALFQKRSEVEATPGHFSGFVWS
ncbi:hypothetical protein, partial [Kosakonia sp.]|uniref:hypothetical protein n=1 Tax=Kosakonia sp. TaxID=1916651 RepID=UPI0028B12DAA